MSICAHESFMSMLMKLSCARARGGVTRTTTLGQYAPRVVKKTRCVIMDLTIIYQFTPLLLAIGDLM